jgi:hypothetical protein
VSDTLNLFFNQSRAEDRQYEHYQEDKLTSYSYIADRSMVTVREMVKKK